MRLSIAPLRGVTTNTFRNVYYEHFDGIDYGLAPFVSATSGERVNLSVLKDIMLKNNTMPIIPQVIGANPKDVKMMCDVIHNELGYNEININMGCPHRPIVSKGRGAGFLKDPDSIKRMLDVLFEEKSYEISVKTRLGYDDPEQILRLMPIFNSYSIKELTLHTRTAVQMYKGITYPEIFSECEKISKIPLVYNGDIFSLSDYQHLKEMLPGTESWMLGRGVISNPLLPHEIKTGKRAGEAELLDKIKILHNALFEEYQKILFGPSHLLGKMKEYWLYLAENLPNSKKFLKKIRRTRSVEDYQRVISDFLGGI